MCALVYEPMTGGWGDCGDSANEYSCVHGAQSNFGDLTPFLWFHISKVFDSVCLSVPQECCFAGPCQNKQAGQETKGRIGERGIRGSGIGKGDIGEGGLVFAFNLRKKAPRYHSATCRGMSQAYPLVPLLGSSNLANVSVLFACSINFQSFGANIFS